MIVEVSEKHTQKNPERYVKPKTRAVLTIFVMLHSQNICLLLSRHVKIQSCHTIKCPEYSVKLDFRLSTFLRSSSLVLFVFHSVCVCVCMYGWTSVRACVRVAIMSCHL